MQPQLVVLPAPQTERHIGPITKHLGHLAQLKCTDVIRHKNADHTVAVAMTSSQCRMQLFLPPRDLPSVIRRVSRE